MALALTPLALLTSLVVGSCSHQTCHPHTNNGTDSYHSHPNREFYVKHLYIYVFVDVLKKIHHSSYVSMNSLSLARTSKYERDKIVMSAHFDYIAHGLLQERSCVRYGPKTDLWKLYWRSFSFARFRITFCHAFSYICIVRFYTLLKCVFSIN